MLLEDSRLYRKLVQRYCRCCKSSVSEGRNSCALVTTILLVEIHDYDTNVTRYITCSISLFSQINIKTIITVYFPVFYLAESGEIKKQRNREQRNVLF
ncbi:hypothetical protein ACO02O_10960 [Dirofilaria immitis]